MQGLGVKPIEYASIKGLITFSANNSLTSMELCLIPMTFALLSASITASVEQQGVLSRSLRDRESKSIRLTPSTSYPCSFRR